MNFDATKMDVNDIGRFDLVIFMLPLRFDGRNPIFFKLTNFSCEQTLRFERKNQLLDFGYFSRENIAI